MPKERPNQRGNAPFHNKKARTDQAKNLIQTHIPALLESNDRAQQGVTSAHLYRGAVDLPSIAAPVTASPPPVPQPVSSPDAESTASQSIPAYISPPSSKLRVRLLAADTLDAAYALHQSHPRSRIAILNMASPLQPGGGVLRGARAQEESLCMRTTLYPSLKEEWYRLPEDGLVYTPDVLVFAKQQSGSLKMLDKEDQWYVDVISCPAVRKPDIEVSNNGAQYADPRDEERMALKIKYIMRLCALRGVERVVLGALGCGAYQNPIAKVARLMRRTLLWKGEGMQEDWKAKGVEEAVFAILDDTRDRKVWEGFVGEFRRVEGVSVHG